MTQYFQSAYNTPISRDVVLSLGPWLSLRTKVESLVLVLALNLQSLVLALALRLKSLLTSLISHPECAPILLRLWWRYINHLITYFRHQTETAADRSPSVVSAHL